VSLVGFKGENHPQQVAARGASDEVDDRGTDPSFFLALNKRFRFSLDVAASRGNAKCERFFTRADDGLAQSWAGERVWCNPPYSNLRSWTSKAWAEWVDGCPLIVMLLPANRTEQGWWQEFVEPYRDRAGSPLTVEFLPGRLRFVKPNQQRIGANERPPFGCCLLIWARPDFRFPTQEGLPI
jgi:phage N-6-adenine-methyltransferase